MILVLGGPDCGKSTFCRYVLGLAQTAARQIAVIDGDLGQSHLGPPATLGLNLYPPHNSDDFGLFPDNLYFIGQTSPPGNMLELVVGLHRLTELARGRGCRRIIVNTSGFINGPAAVRLKLAKAETLGRIFASDCNATGNWSPFWRPCGNFARRCLPCRFPARPGANSLPKDGFTGRSVLPAILPRPVPNLLIWIA